MKTYNFKDRVNIVLCGGAGQGIQTIEVLLTKILKSVGYNVYATKEYMSRVRGGSNSTTIMVSSVEHRCLYNNIDILVALNSDAVKHLEKRITNDTIILDEANIDFNGIATKLGNKIYANSVAVGYLIGLLKLVSEIPQDLISSIFSGKLKEVIDKNIEAILTGYDEAQKTNNIVIEINTSLTASKDLIMNGSDAVAIGSVAGGCNFISSYPMSPSTGVFTNLAKFSKEVPLLVEQVEDEISAINMALGAWYAGSKAIVSTSGGGFCLMTEGLSLAGMIESPLVLHLSQRPAPATGLPTRTDQSDLNLALYAGHGDFPRILLAPGNIEQGARLSTKAFYYADKYQVPVIILTDQYFMDTYYNVSKLDLSGIDANKSFIVETTPDYQRYKLTNDGISPRGIPSFGKGFVRVDSDEHDESGRITEDLDIRVKMTDKRMQKLELLKEDTIAPLFLGESDYTNLIIAWGSTYHSVKNVLETLKPDKTAYLFFEQIYPLNNNILDYLKKAKNIICLENNFTGQFANLLEHQFKVKIDKRILKYNGLAFSQEEITTKLKEVLI